MPRIKGTKDIPKAKKARILAKKNTQLATQVSIARDEKVSKSVVSRITESSVPPDVLQLSKKYELQYATYAEANAMKAQQRAFDTIHELNAKDATIVAEKNFNMAQALRGSSGTNSPSVEQIALRFLSLLIEKGITEQRAQIITQNKYPDVKLLTEAI